MAGEISTVDIYAALQAGADDDDINALIGAMLGDASDHAVMTWRRDNYLDLRHWASPQTTEIVTAQSRIAAGGSLALEGQADLDNIYRRILAADLRFPADPYIPAAEVIEPPIGDE